jgi:hypothetical protein
VAICRPSALGLLMLLGAVTGCEAEADRTVSVSTDAAVVSYAAPDGAPSFCTTLAGSTRLAAIPRAIGALAAETGTVEARLDLTAGIDDLQAVLEDVRADEGHERLGSAIEQLVATLTSAMDSPLTDAVRTGISDDLDAVGRQAQPICRFPS